VDTKVTKTKSKDQRKSPLPKTSVKQAEISKIKAKDTTDTNQD
jgi:hypothetical protein